MYVLFEDSGSFKAEKIFSEAEATLQVEAASGRRSKIRRNNVLLTFSTPEPEQLLEEAHALANDIDIPFLWEFAPKDDFDATELASDYYGPQPSAVQQAALIFALQNAPIYFHRRGRGRYRAAPPDILEAALAAQEKRRQEEALQQEWVDALLAGQMPEAIGQQKQALLFSPDKNSLEYKAFNQAVQQLACTPEQLMLNLKAWPHPLALMRERFFNTHFPKGIDFPSFSQVKIPDGLPLADVTAYSVDDADTTEVDDALSVSPVAENVYRIGVHIAAPGLLIQRGSELDEIARARMSTVYMPGQKIPMLPEALIEQCSLDAQTAKPALSLYATVNIESGELLETETRLEQIIVQENLRSDELSDLVTEEALNDASQTLPYAEWLRPLWAYACHLGQEREAHRGRPENNLRTEYTFTLEGPPDDPDSLVRLTPRHRNAPLDRLIAEYMIFANNQWGKLLAQHDVPGVYRSQQGGRVRMTTHPLPHDTIGVPQYIWATSPLRRYIDLINQWQIIAAAKHGVSARLAAPFKPKEADLFAIIGAFDSQYASWAEFQREIERYWCLRWLQQQNLRQVQATVIRDDLVRLNCAPLVIKLPSLPALEKGQNVIIDLLRYDELALEVEARFIKTDDAAPETAPCDEQTEPSEANENENRNA